MTARSGITSGTSASRARAAARATSPTRRPARSRPRWPSPRKREIDAAVQIAKKAQLAWAATPPLRRQRVMFNLKSLIEKRTDDLARLMSLEHGKTFDDAKGEVGRGLEVVEFSCGIAHHMRGDFTEQVASDMDTWSIRQPLGVVAGITPFNFPIMIPCWMGAMAVACGNAFILKPSEKDPSAPMLLAELFAEAGAAGRHLPGAERRQGRGRCAAEASRRAGDLLRRLDGDRRVRLSPGHASATNACRRCAAPRTTW